MAKYPLNIPLIGVLDEMGHDEDPLDGASDAEKLALGQMRPGKYSLVVEQDGSYKITPLLKRGERNVNEEQKLLWTICLMVLQLKVAEREKKQTGRVNVSREENIKAIIRDDPNLHKKDAGTLARESRRLEERSLSGREIQQINGVAKRLCDCKWFVQWHETVLKRLRGDPHAKIEIRLNHITRREGP
jgi:hypothetical protein